MVTNASRGRAVQVPGARSAVGRGRARPLVVCLLVLALAPAIVRSQTGTPKPSRPPSKQMFVRHVPNFVTLALDSAIVRIRTLDRGVVDSLVPSPAPSGIVIRQWPDTTVRLADVRTIYLVVSSGQRPNAVVRVPPVRGLSIARATALVTGANLRVRLDSPIASSDRSKAVVRDQVPRGNSIVQRGSLVTLTPSVPSIAALPWWRQVLALLDTTPWIVAGVVVGLLLLSVPVIRYFWPTSPRIVLTSGVGSAHTSIAFTGPNGPQNASPATIDRDAVELVAQLSTASHTVIAVAKNDDLIRGDSHDD